MGRIWELTRFLPKFQGGGMTTEKPEGHGAGGLQLWRISKKFRFEASHQLPNHDGKCARLHGHSWGMKVTIGGHNLIDHGPKADMLMDYADLKALVKPLLDDYLDHWHLNDTTNLENPTSEALAAWVYGRLRGSLPRTIYLTVQIDETCTSECQYEEAGHK